MNKSNQLEPMLNAFLSDLAVLNIKVHNLHWNVEGREFALIHEMTEKIYKMLQDQFDENGRSNENAVRNAAGNHGRIFRKIPELKKFPPAITALPKSWTFWTKTAGF